MIRRENETCRERRCGEGPRGSDRYARSGSRLAHRIPTNGDHRAADDARAFPGHQPTLLVPILERPDAEVAEGAGSLTLVDWEDGTDPYGVASPLLRADGEFGISDPTWAMHLLGLQRVLPGSQLPVAVPRCLPMMRAVKDDNELMRLAAAGAAADSTYGEIVQRRFAGRLRPKSPLILLICCESSDTSRSTSRSSAPVRNEANPRP